MCPIVIKLYSPAIKIREETNMSVLTIGDKTGFATSVRLMRIVVLLISKFFKQLVSHWSSVAVH